MEAAGAGRHRRVGRDHDPCGVMLKKSSLLSRRKRLGGSELIPSLLAKE